MDKMWQAENLDLCLLPYGCLSTGHGVGMIEVILNAETVSCIQVAHGGTRAAFKDQPLEEWLRKQNPDDRDYEKAVETFTLSCAGYCVATYVLGIGDRHNDNIMLTKSGMPMCDVLCGAISVTDTSHSSTQETCFILISAISSAILKRNLGSSANVLRSCSHPISSTSWANATAWIRPCSNGSSTTACVPFSFFDASPACSSAFLP